VRLTDRRLYQAASFEDFKFRLRYRDEDNKFRRTRWYELTKLATWEQRKSGYLQIGFSSFIAPDTEQIFGGDFSPWDGNVNMQVFADYGAKFAIIKAIDGTVPSRYWRENTQRAIAAGLLTGPYGWLYPDRFVSCRSQAQAYWNLIKDTPLTLPPVIDFEWTNYAGQPANPNYSDLDKWATEFNRLSKVKPILYSAAGFINPLGRMPQSLKEKFSGFWWASYGGLTLPIGFSNWDIHQFTAFGDALTLAPGDRNKLELDLNYMTDEFAKKYNLTEPLPPPDEEHEVTMDKWKATWDGGCNKRPAPNTNNTPVGVIPDNTEFDVVDYFIPVGRTEAQERWGKLINGYWVALVYNSQPRAVPVGEPTPESPAEFPPRVGLVFPGSDVVKWYVAE
jgi:GH25 family lysozyme M1 (1,4-beta-N-acetylmuramidase)